MKESELERIEYTDFCLGAIETVQSSGTLLEMTMKEKLEPFVVEKVWYTLCRRKGNKKTFLYYSKKERKLLYSKKRNYSSC